MNFAFKILVLTVPTNYCFDYIPYGRYCQLGTTVQIANDEGECIQKHILTVLHIKTQVKFHQK